jgi:positive regulator of sigma E activity
MSATTSEVSQTTQKSTCSSCQAKAAMNASTPTTSSKHSQFFGIDINKSLVVGLLLGMIFAAVLHMKIEIGNG